MTGTGKGKAVARKTLTDRELKVVNFIDQKFWETGFVPSYEAVGLATKEAPEYVKGLIERNQLARKSLIVRGVDLKAEESAGLLTSEQLMAANVMLNAHDKRSVREKLEFLNISSQQWHAWLRQPGFSQYMSKRAEAAFEGNDWKAYDALRENIEEGRLEAVKLHFEMRGKYKQQVDVNVNIEQVLTRVIEIISRHVNDEEVLVAIAEDFSNLNTVDGGQAAIAQRAS